MAITEWMEKLGRVIFESPFGAIEIARDAPELSEIRLAVLDEVKAKSHRVGGRQVFPYNVIRIHLRGVPTAKSKLFTGKFFAQFCQEELRSGLSKLNYRFPADLQVEVETTPDLPAAKEHWLIVEAESRADSAPAASGTKRAARLVVLKGLANQTELALTKARTNIGRTVDVYRADGPSRRNDLAFDEANEISRTVSREHAHVTYNKKTGEYRLFNDRSYQPDTKPGASCGLWIIRDGLSNEVHRGARGVKLESGDEVHLGRAVLKFMAK